MVNFKYRAFISYSHKDKKWGDWLHKGLERYRIPKNLIGQETRLGAIPAKIFPVFRDREELPTSSDLSTAIREALENSQSLIVICSRNSAQSKWVNEEILAFKRIHGEDNILAIIVDGEPHGTDKPGLEDQECFPPALRFKMGKSGKLTKQPTEPIAADARENGDGKDDALLKLIAGVLGVNFNDLKKREVQEAKRRARRSQMVAACMGVLAVLALGAGWFAWEKKSEADHQSRIAVEERDKAKNAKKQADRQSEFAKEQKQKAERALKSATQTANKLIFDIAVEMRNKAVPASVSIAVLDQAQNLQRDLDKNFPNDQELARSKASALIEIAKIYKTHEDLSKAKEYAEEALALSLKFTSKESDEENTIGAYLLLSSLEYQSGNIENGQLYLKKTEKYLQSIRDNISELQSDKKINYSIYSKAALSVAKHYMKILDWEKTQKHLADAKIWFDEFSYYDGSFEEKLVSLEFRQELENFYLAAQLLSPDYAQKLNIDHLDRDVENAMFAKDAQSLYRGYPKNPRVKFIFASLLNMSAAKKYQKYASEKSKILFRPSKEQMEELAQEILFSQTEVLTLFSELIAVDSNNRYWVLGYAQSLLIIGNLFIDRGEFLHAHQYINDVRNLSFSQISSEPDDYVFLILHHEASRLLSTIELKTKKLDHYFRFGKESYDLIKRLPEGIMNIGPEPNRKMWRALRKKTLVEYLEIDDGLLADKISEWLRGGDYTNTVTGLNFQLSNYNERLEYKGITPLEKETISSYITQLKFYKAEIEMEAGFLQKSLSTLEELSSDAINQLDNITSDDIKYQIVLNFVKAQNGLSEIYFKANQHQDAAAQSKFALNYLSKISSIATDPELIREYALVEAILAEKLSLARSLAGEIGWADALDEFIKILATKEGFPTNFRPQDKRDFLIAKTKNNIAEALLNLDRNEEALPFLMFSVGVKVNENEKRSIAEKSVIEKEHKEILIRAGSMMARALKNMGELDGAEEYTTSVINSLVELLEFYPKNPDLLLKYAESDLFLSKLDPVRRKTFADTIVAIEQISGYAKLKPGHVKFLSEAKQFLAGITIEQSKQ